MKKGFSLVELSIVLVILGLLTGGILAGQSLIRASELRSVSTEYQKYRSAMYSFRDKYFAIPGDMVNAVKFWGAQAGATTDGMDTTCRDLTTAATSAATCNGNGDGDVNSTGTENYESYRVWQQLANAGLIEGSFSGVTAGAANTLSPSIGTNLPRSKISNAGYTMRWYPVTDASDLQYFAGNYGNMLWFGAASAAYTNAAILKPEEAWNIDTKLDDGRPGYGMVVIPENSTNCHTNADPSLAQYNLTDTANRCQFIMLLGF